MVKRKKSLAEKILEKDYCNLVKKVGSGKTLTAAERALVQAKAAQTLAQSTEQHAAPDQLPPYVTNKTDLARLLNVSRQAVHNWFNLANHPKADAAGRHDVAAWVRFREENGLKGDETSAEASAKAWNFRLRNEKLEEEIAILRGAHTPNEVFIAQMNDLSAGLNSLLLRKEKEWPLKLANKSREDLVIEYRAVFDDMRERIRNLVAKWKI
jgi:hypothetical protein